MFYLLDTKNYETATLIHFRIITGKMCQANLVSPSKCFMSELKVKHDMELMKLVPTPKSEFGKTFEISIFE